MVLKETQKKRDIGNNAVGIIEVIAGEEEEGVESDDLEKSWRMKEEKSLYQLVP